MTRINTIDVKDLTDQHLMAEYRELPMVHASLRRSKASKKGLRVDNIPDKYTLNKGHVTFFYDKGRWLYRRWTELITELHHRGYSIDPSQRDVNWGVFDVTLYKDWKPDNQAHVVNLERIVYRINEKREWYRYRGEPVSEEFLTKLTEKYDVKNLQV